MISDRKEEGDRVELFVVEAVKGIAAARRNTPLGIGCNALEAEVVGRRGTKDLHAEGRRLGAEKKALEELRTHANHDSCWQKSGMCGKQSAHSMQGHPKATPTQRPSKGRARAEL